MPKKKSLGAKCSHVTREVEQRRMVAEQGIKWHCPKCKAELFVWASDFIQLINSGKVVSVQCDKCKTVHTVDDNRLVSLGDNIVVPTLKDAALTRHKVK